MHPAFFVFFSSIPSLLPPVKRIFYLPPEIFHGRMYAPPVFGQTEAVSQIRKEVPQCPAKISRTRISRTRISRESEIPVADYIKVEFLGEDGTYKAENDIPGFSLSDVAPELFD